MARQTAPLEVNSFVQGLVTEASPLTFPENASLDEDNFELLRDGSRRRRLGMDYEAGYQVVNTGQASPEGGEIALTTFNWENAGGVSDKELLVVQAGTNIRVFDLDISPLSTGQVYSTNISGADPTQVFSFASVDGTLVCTTGEASVVEITYNEGTLSRRNRRIKIRDFFGVATTLGGRDLREGNNVSLRPTSRNNAHIYNLRNQSWGVPRSIGDSGSDEGSSTALRDPLERFYNLTSRYPSNSDTVVQALYPDPGDENNRTGDQFFPRDLRDNPVGNMPAANGHFIIDALDRGASRLEEVQLAYSQYPQLTYPVSSLPADRTPGGATSVAEYAGRVWYAGFPGEVVGGDRNSPQMSSYILYSKLVQSPQDITVCYQEGDPTTKEAPDLIDTDGGFIRLDGAYEIQKLINIGKVLMVVAQNGVWSIGGGEAGFSANNIEVNKISEKGSVSPGSVVEVDSTFMFWGDDAIYHIAQNEFGDWVANNLTLGTIQKLYDEIRPVDKRYCQGRYDSYEGKVKWVYQNLPTSNRAPRELIIDTMLGAFYTSTIRPPSDTYPRVTAPLVVPPFRLTENVVDVVVEGEPVTAGGQEVTVSIPTRGASTQELAYLIVTGSSPLRYTFGLYRDNSFRDFVSHDGVGVDAEAFLVTGWTSGGDFQRMKQVPYIQFHFNRTETGFFDDGTGNLFPQNPSSCKVQAQWEWTNSPASNRWGREFEAYRYRRMYFPGGSGDSFDTGEQVITTKNKLRGKGRVVSFLIRTTPGHDCQLLGWSMLIGVAGNV